MQSMDPAIQTTNAGYDDLSCAARYTLAAFVIHGIDSNAAEYYASRAAAAGQRYMEMHPGESEQSYASRVAAGAQDIQQRLSTKALTPEALVEEIKHCDKDSDSLTVL
jgi:hypothetical protein